MNRYTTRAQNSSEQERRPVLVLGGTGKTGRRVAARLRTAGVPVRAVSRSTPVRFDWADPATWPAALADVSAVYVVGPEEPAPLHEVLERAVEAGAQRLVALSGRGLDDWGADFGAGMAALEKAVQEAGAEWTIMRPNNFAQNFDEDLFHGPLMSGELALPIGDTPEPFIDAEDIAETAAVLLTEDGHHGRIYEMSGPRALTFAEAVATIAEASGRRMRFRDVTPEEYTTAQLARGAGKEETEAVAAMFAIMRRGVLAEPAPGVRQVLGREPADFTSYAVRAAAAGAWS